MSHIDLLTQELATDYKTSAKGALVGTALAWYTVQLVPDFWVINHCEKGRQNMKYEKNIDGMFGLKITDSNLATVTGDVDQPPVTVQLASDAEATKMIAEFEDPEGELMHTEDAIFGKYPELHQFKP